jgi:argininosuccinate lyase
MVLYCIENTKALDELTLVEFKNFSDKIGNDVYTEISLEKCVSGRNLPGGPGKDSVLASINQAKKFLSIYAHLF